MIPGKTGIAVITCNRRHFFERCTETLPSADVRVVVNDGAPYDYPYSSHYTHLIQHTKNTGVGIAKNDGLKYLMQEQCEHLFVVEDDIYFKQPGVLELYINAARKSGVLHLNYAYHGPGNRNEHQQPVARLTVNDNSGAPLLTLNKNILGAFSYYHYTVIEKLGYIHEAYKNAWEHVDHTVLAIKAGLHPPFWWFADAAGSETYIEDQVVNHGQSAIRKNKLKWWLSMRRNTFIFKRRHGVRPWLWPDTPQADVLTILDRIKNTYGEKL